MIISARTTPRAKRGAVICFEGRYYRLERPTFFGWAMTEIDKPKSSKRLLRFATRPVVLGDTTTPTSPLPGNTLKE